MLKFLKTCLFCVLSVTAQFSHADSQVIIKDTLKNPVLLGEYINQWTGDYLPLDKLKEQIYLFSFWKPSDASSSSNLLTNKPLQLMFSIENRSAHTRNLVMVHPHSSLDAIKIQYWSDGKKLAEYETGNLFPFHSRPINHRHFVFPLTIESGKNITIMIETTGRMDTFFKDFYLWEKDAFFQKTDLALIGYAMLLGVLLLLMLYHLLIFVIIKDISHFWFAFFVSALLARALTMHNIAFEFLWPDTPFMQNFMLVNSVMWSSLFTALFAIAYLPITRRTPNLLLTYRIYIASIFVAMAIQAGYGWPIQGVIYWLFVAGPFSLVIIVSSFWLYRHGNKHAGIFLLGYSMLFVSGLISAGNQFFNFNLPFNPSEEIGQLLQILLLSLALSWRIGESREKAHIAFAKNKAKSDFLAKMSHEIRTPINGVLGMAQLLSETPLSRKQQHYADVINHCSKTLLNVINNILEYSKIEAGKIELENTPFNIDDLLLNNNGLFWPQIHNKGITYQFYLDPSIPHHLLGDPTRLQQIFNNIYSNAIKFTDNGSIKLVVRAKKLSLDTVDIQFSLADTGIGIREEDIENLFVPFSQANVSTTRLYGGSGLGLNITQQLVKLMGGSIDLKSEPKVGSQFTFNIPFKVDVAAESRKRTGFSLFADKRALVLSREDPREDLIKQVIEYLHIKSEHVTDIDEGFRLITQNIEKPFDIYCIDLAIFNDYSTAQRKALHQQGQQILVYDCTFNGSSSDLYLEGFHFMIAPFSIRHIQNQLADIFGIAHPSITSTTKTLPLISSHSKLHLLVAEDDATNRLVIRAILKKLDIEHDIVANGVLAVERYQENPKAYDILLMDCEMPEMNGYQAAKAIRDYESSHGLRAVPIIALTAHVLPEYEQRCYENGMNRVIAKPVDIEELSTAFNEFVNAAPVDIDE